MSDIKTSPDRICAAVRTFCRINGIDPESDSAIAFRAVLIGEISCVLLNSRGAKVESPIDIYLAQNPAATGAFVTADISASQEASHRAGLQRHSMRLFGCGCPVCVVKAGLWRLHGPTVIDRKRACRVVTEEP